MPSLNSRLIGCFAVLFLMASPPLVARAHAAPATQPSTAPIAVPESRGGGDLVGKTMPADEFTRWLRTEGAKPPESKGVVTLYRWWTDTCPFCESSLPAIETLREKYGPHGFRVVAVYHPKPPRDVDDKTLTDAADRLGYRGPIAVDRDWTVLRKLYLSTGRRGATSASFLVDRAGVIRYVHPGPDFFPSTDGAFSRQNEDFVAIERAVQALLAEPEPKSKDAAAKR